ncbi:MAG: hypothetical protein AMXMBFR64_50080 [Myxococcales bacterium]
MTVRNDVSQVSVEDPSRLDLKRYAFVLYKRKWIIAVFFIAVVSGMVFRTSRQTPVYRATASVIIDRNPPRVLPGMAEVIDLGNANYWSNKEYFQTQYRIIKSRAVAESVVDRLGLRYNAAFLGVSEELQREEPDRAAELMASRDPVDALIQRIEVEPLKDSMMVFISIEDPDPAFAMELANAVANAYRSENLEHKQRVVNEAYGELSGIVADLGATKEAAETAARDFERLHEVGTFENQKKAIDQRIATINADLDVLRRESEQAQAELSVVRRYKNEKDIFKVSLAEVLASPIIQQLKTQWLELKSEMKGLETDYGDLYPKVRSTKERLSLVEAAARKEVKNIITSVEHRVERLKMREQRLLERLKAAQLEDSRVAELKIEYQRLVEKREDARLNFDKVSQRQTETKMTSQVNVNNVRLLDLAQMPTVPVKPNMKLNVALGMLLGLFGGITLAFFVEFMDNTVKSRLDIEQVAQVTFLGMVPTIRTDKRHRRHEEAFEGKKELYVHYRPKSTVAELSRTIRTNLLFMLPGGKLRTFVVTSPGPQEGKTTISINLGITMAASGGRVVLIDTDMRRPKLHTSFDAPSDVGVSNYLVGKDPITRFVIPTEVPGLDLIPCGPCPPNPAELLHTERFRELIAELEQHYETIIFDSPPIIAVTDAIVIGTQVDGVVLVAKSGKTTKETLLHARNSLAAVNARILGCVLNDLDLDSGRYGYYHYVGRYGSYYGETEPADGPA